MANPYDASGVTNEYATRPPQIPDKAVVVVTLTGVPVPKTVGKNNTPVAEAEFVVRGGDYDGTKLRKSLWLNPVPKEGKDKSALYWSQKFLCDGFLVAIGCPAPEYDSKGKETPQSQAKCAPFRQKWQQQVAGATDPTSMLTKACTPLVGKPIPARVSVTRQEGTEFDNREVKTFLTQEQYQKATAPKPAAA